MDRDPPPKYATVAQVERLQASVDRLERLLVGIEPVLADLLVGLGLAPVTTPRPIQ